MQILLSKEITVWFKKKPVTVEVFIFNKEAEIMAPDWFLKAVQNEQIFIDRRLEDERSLCMDVQYIPSTGSYGHI